MRPSLYLAALPVTAPNGLRLSGARKGVRCSRGLDGRPLLGFSITCESNRHGEVEWYWTTVTQRGLVLPLADRLERHCGIIGAWRLQNANVRHVPVSAYPCLDLYDSVRVIFQNPSGGLRPTPETSTGAVTLRQGGRPAEHDMRAPAQNTASSEPAAILPPNGLELSGARKRVRCSDLLGRVAHTFSLSN